MTGRMKQQKRLKQTKLSIINPVKRVKAINRIGLTGFQAEGKSSFACKPPNSLLARFSDPP